jgi:hypothetical protein
MLKNLPILAAALTFLLLAPSCTTPPKSGQPEPGKRAAALVQEGQMTLLDDKIGPARMAFAKALILDPDCAEAAYNLGRLEEKAGNPEKALDAYGIIGRRNPDHKLAATARNRYNRILAARFAKKIAEEVKQLGDRSVAVLDFTDKDGRPSYLGTLFGEALSTAIAELKEPAITLVERKEIKALLAEKMLDETDLVDRRRAVDVKGFISVDILVTGKVLEETFVKALIKDTARSILNSSYPTFGGGETEPISKPWAQLTQIRNAKPGFAVRLWTDKALGAPYFEGDTVTFFYSVEKLSYVFIYALQPDGSILQLFPNPYTPEWRVEPGKVHMFPAKDAGFDIPVEGPHFGLQRVKLIACTRNVNPLDMKPREPAMKSIAKDDDTTMRNLKIRLAAEPQTEWADTIIRFPTLPRESSK